MNREEIIAMAREAGFTNYKSYRAATHDSEPLYQAWGEEIEKFAALVAAKEREECAKVVEAAQPWGRIVQTAAAIRARGQQ